MKAKIKDMKSYEMVAAVAMDYRRLLREALFTPGADVEGIREELYTDPDKIRAFLAVVLGQCLQIRKPDDEIDSKEVARYAFDEVFNAEAAEREYV